MGSEMTPLLVFEGGASEAPPRGTTRIRYAVGGRVKSNFSLISNNAENKYGTASLVKNEYLVENLMFDTFN